MISPASGIDPSQLWKRLILRDRRVASGSEIREISKEIGPRTDHSVQRMEKEGYLVRILPEIYYVRTPDEFKKMALDLTSLEIVGLGLEKKGVENWYFGLDTALELNHITNETHEVIYTITDSFRTGSPIRIVDKDFLFLKREKGCFESGIRELKNYFFSDPEKTVLDLMYDRYIKDKENPVEYMQPLNAHYQFLDPIILISHLKSYPRAFQNALECQIQGFYDTFS